MLPSNAQNPSRLRASPHYARDVEAGIHIAPRGEAVVPAAPGAWMAPPLSKAELIDDGIEGAIARYAATVASAGRSDARSTAISRPRLYSFPETTVVLGMFAISLLALESEGLLTWVGRMEVGPLQIACMSALQVMHAALEPIALTRPRRIAIGAGDRLARVLGAGDDPVLAGGWQKTESQPERVKESARPPELPDEQVDDEPPTIQRAPDPPEEVAAAQEEDQPPNAPATVLLVGDSMIAGSLSSAIVASLNRDPKQRVIRAVQTGTGLSRPDVFDWMKVIPPLLEREKPQVIVCSLGANDATNIREGDRLLEFAHAGWRSAYAERVAAMMQMLSSQNARVLWLGLPRMREGWFSERARYLNKIFAQAAKEFPQVEYFDVDMLVSAPNGEYATFIKNQEGRFVRVRMDDGVHYSPWGARAVARWVVDWIYERQAGPSNAGG